MIPLLLALSLTASAQEPVVPVAVSSPTPGMSLFDRQRIDAIDQAVTELTSGKPNVTGLPTYRQGIKFADGTTQTTAASAATALNSISSITYCTQVAYAVTANWLNKAVSTITYTSNTGRVRVHFQANRIQSSNSGSATRSSVLLNGYHLGSTGPGPNYGYSNSQGPGGGIDTVTHSWELNISTTAGVAHSFALVLGSDGTININMPVVGAAPNGDRSCAVFSVQDIP